MNLVEVTIVAMLCSVREISPLVFGDCLAQVSGGDLVYSKGEGEIEAEEREGAMRGGSRERE